MKFNNKWLPAIITPVVIAATAIAVPISASAVDLPDLTPQQVMLLMDERVPAFSGTIVKTSNLGLPSFKFSSMVTQDMIDEMAETMPEGMEELIPEVLDQNPLMEAIALIAGTHKIRVYVSEEGVRIQILDPMSQRDLIINENEFWIYDSQKATATNGTFPEMAKEVTEAEKQDIETMFNSSLDELSAKLQLDLRSPDAIADYLVAQVDKDAELTVGRDHRIAGRTAYQLILTPDAQNALIDSVEISVDSETGMALDVKVYSVEMEEPAFQIGFTELKLETPDASLFTFSPPPGTTVQKLDEQLLSAIPAEDFASLEAALMQAQSELDELGPLSEAGKEAALVELEAEFNRARAELTALGVVEPSLIGTGWESILYIPAAPEALVNDVASEVSKMLPEGMSLSQLSDMAILETEIFADLFVEVPGGKAFSTPVVNILLMDNGDIYVGSVTIDYLVTKISR